MGPSEWLDKHSCTYIWSDFPAKLLLLGELFYASNEKYREYCIPQLLKELGCSTGVEVGVLRGDLSRGLVKYLDGPIYLVDPWETFSPLIYDDVANTKHGVQEDNYKKVIAELGDKAEIMRMTSMMAYAILGSQEKELDFVYIDANHWYPHVIQDIFAWWRLIRKGGILCGHDFMAHEGVTEAIINFIKAYNIPRFYASEGTDWFIVKDRDTMFFPSKAGRSDVEPSHGEAAGLIQIANQKRIEYIDSLPPEIAKEIHAADNKRRQFVLDNLFQPKQS